MVFVVMGVPAQVRVEPFERCPNAAADLFSGETFKAGDLSKRPPLPEGEFEQIVLAFIQAPMRRAQLGVAPCHLASFVGVSQAAECGDARVFAENDGWGRGCL